MLKIKTSKKCKEVKSKGQLQKDFAELKKQCKELLLITIADVLGIFLSAWIFKFALNTILKFLGMTCIPFGVALAFIFLIFVIKDIK